MSRHSKNSNAQTIFTYAQRSKLKNEYGTIQTRLGQDSMKKVQMCTICTNSMIEPTACDKGHMFCRSCVIQFLVKQKKRITAQNQEVQKEKSKQAQKEKQKQLAQKVRVIENFEKYDSFCQITGRDRISLQKQQKSQLKSEKVTSKDVKPIGIYQLDSSKDKYLKSSFWTVQNTPKIEEKLQKQNNKIKCPGSSSENHHISLKKLRNILCKETQGQYLCWICSKQINRQRIGAYKCGHLVCIDCKSNQCQMCSVNQGWLELQRSHSSFSQHKKSEVKTYVHAFVV